MGDGAAARVGGQSGAGVTARLRADVAALLARAPAVDAAGFDPASAREALRRSSALADLPRDPAVAVRDLAIQGPGGALPLRLYRPAEADDTSAVVLFFHGGGWVLGDLDTHDGLASAIAGGLGLRLVAVDYRRAPEHVFPAALDDCAAALRWLAAAPVELGAAPDGIVLAGDSAGGNIAAACALSGIAPVLALWTMYASFDMDAVGGSMDEYAAGHGLTAELLAIFRASYFADGASRHDPRASPLLAEDLSAMPPALIFANECDPLRDQSRAFAGRLAAAGRPVRYREARGHVHGSLARRALVPSSRADLAGCIDDLRGLIVEARMEQEWA